MTIFRIAFACALLANTTAALAENTVITCSTSRARAAKPAPGPALVANVASAMTPIPLNAVQFTDTGLGRSVITQQLFAQRAQNNSLNITARFVNCTKKPLVMQARTNFLDVNNFPTEKVSAWKTIYLSPLATSIYEEKSIGTTNVAAFYVELRPNL